MRGLLQQVVVKCQLWSLSLYCNVRPSLAARATNLGSHLFRSTPDCVDALAAWLQVILSNEHYPYGGCAGRILAEAKFDSLHPGGQGAALSHNVMKQTSFVNRCNAD